MARPSFASKLTIAQLEQLIEDRRGKLGGLIKKREKLAAKLADLDKTIASLNGGKAPASISPSAGPGRKRTRAKNDMSLVDALDAALGDSGKAMSVSDIVDKVKANGYRSTSANFRALVNQTLIKDKRFVAESRGMYGKKK